MNDVQDTPKLVIQTDRHRGDTPVGTTIPPVQEPTRVPTAPLLPPAQEPIDAPPRSFSEIIGDVPAEKPAPAPVRTIHGVTVSPAVLIGGMAALGLAVVLLIVALVPATPQATIAPTGVSTAIVATVTPVVPTAAPTSESNAASDGVHLAIAADGTPAITLDAENACVPTWASPPPAWKDAQIQFISERTGCLDRTSNLQIIGWWGETNWVYLLRPKAPNADITDARQVDLVWSDITWFGHTLAEVKQLPGVAKGEIKDYAPGVVVAQAPSPIPAPAAPAPPVATPEPYVEPTATPLPEPTATPEPTAVPTQRPTESTPYYVSDPHPTPTWEPDTRPIEKPFSNDTHTNDAPYYAH